LQKQQKNGGSSCCFCSPNLAGLAETAADQESKNIHRLILIAPRRARARRPLRPRKGPLCFRRPKRHRRRIIAENEIPFSFAGATVPAPAGVTLVPSLVLVSCSTLSGYSRAWESIFGVLQPMTHHL